MYWPGRAHVKLPRVRNAAHNIQREIFCGPVVVPARQVTAKFDIRGISGAQ
jgi:hypothetical protein